MKLLAHRGLWDQQVAKNSRAAFEAAAAARYGIETDVRDSRGALVISHDPPRGGEMEFADFLRIPGVAEHPLAINIKADGLAPTVAGALRAAKARDAFVFDMSVPDQRAHLRAGTPTFTRLSDLEPHASLLDQCNGVWLDAFLSDWWNEGTVVDLVAKGKRVAVVSPELHGRDPTNAWSALARLHAAERSQVLLCTDWPAKARAAIGPKTGPA